MNEVYILTRGDELYGVYSTYQKPIHSIMINFGAVIKDYTYQFGVDFFTDNCDVTWSIEPKTMDEM